MKYEIFERLKAIGFVPEYVVSSVDDAVFLASSLEKAKLPVLTLKGEKSFDAFDAVRKVLPQCTVGVLAPNDKDYIEKAVAAGFQYVILNSFDSELLSFCAEKGYAVIPGVSCASEIVSAKNLGFELVNYFPCTKDSLDPINILSQEYSSMHFMLSGAIDRATAYKALLNPRIVAVVGDFMLDYDGIESRCEKKVSDFASDVFLTYLNFHVAHMGMNANSKDESVAMATRLANVIHRNVREGKKSAFAGKLFEIMYSPFYYEKGHVALGSYDATRAYHYLKRCGVEFIEDSMSFDGNGRVVAGYMKENFGGFGIHLLQVAPNFWATI